MEKRTELLHRCPVLDRSEIVPGWHLFELEAPGLAHSAPGQFVQLRIGKATDPLLRRPVSIHLADPSAGRIRLLIRAAGRGTTLAAGVRTGDELDLLGPLGRGFPFLEEGSPALLVGGGIGMAPLFFAAVQRQGAGLPFELLLGSRRGSLLPPDQYFQDQGIKPLLVTEDGSRGGCGTVIALLEKRLALIRGPARVHACGPGPMLPAVVELARSAGVPVHLSLEARMACGVGACLGCVLPVCNGGNIEYRRVCRDGPVFNGEEVYFE